MLPYLLVPLTESTYAYLGKYRSHRDDITGLSFVSDAELVSVSNDGFKVSYDLDKTSIRNGVVLKGPRVRCERTGTFSPSLCSRMTLTH